MKVLCHSGFRPLISNGIPINAPSQRCSDVHAVMHDGSSVSGQYPLHITRNKMALAIEVRITLVVKHAVLPALGYKKTSGIDE